MKPQSTGRVDAAAESDCSVTVVGISVGTLSAFLNPMERRDDGDEPVGSLSAEELGKSALFPYRFLYKCCYINRNIMVMMTVMMMMIMMVCARSLRRSEKNQDLHVFALFCQISVVEYVRNDAFTCL